MVEIIKMHKIHIPFTQPLSPSQLFFPKRNCQKLFPFSSSRSRYYYLARNGIWHAVDALGLKSGDGVLMPAYHHGVEVEVLKKKGLRMFYYRIDEKMQVDFDHLESLVSSDTRLLYIIHYLGFPQKIKPLLSFTASHNLFLFEDCALSLFSRAPEGSLGNFGDVSIFCLYKTLPMPHGGILVVNRNDLPLPSLPQSPNLFSTTGYLANRIIDHFELEWGRIGHGLSSYLRSMGRTFKKMSKVKSIPIETNSFEEALVSLGISRVTQYLLNSIDTETIVHRRRYNFLYLVKLLDGKVWMPFTELPEGICPLSLPIFVRDKEEVYCRLLSEGVETVTFWSVSNPEIAKGTFPEVDFLRRHVLEVPVHQELKKKHLEYIALKLKEHAIW
jgi:dTDP-4-amino-4,6-dideoxygalactose transaminase